MNNTTDLSKSFSKMIGSMFINYRGSLLEVVPEGYRWNRQLFYTIEELDKEINKSLIALSKSISK